jgi:hypothetical protein
MSYSRNSFKKVVPDGKGGQMLDHLSGSYTRLVRNLSLAQYHRVGPHEAGDLPKLAHKFYGSTDLWWAIGLYNGIVNAATQMPAGTLVKIPDVSSIDAYIRQSKTKQTGGVVVLD